MALLLEDARSSLGCVESTIEVNFHYIPPLLRCVILGRDTRRDARVGNNNVQLPKVCRDLLHCLLNALLLTNVCLICCSLYAICGSDF